MYRTICSMSFTANESVICCKFKSCRIERRRSQRNLLFVMKLSSRPSKILQSWSMANCNPFGVRTISGVIPSTMRVYFFTHNSGCDVMRSSASGRSNSSKSPFADRNARSFSGHIKSHVPTTYPDVMSIISPSAFTLLFAGDALGGGICVVFAMLARPVTG